MISKLTIVLHSSALGLSKASWQVVCALWLSAAVVLEAKSAEVTLSPNAIAMFQKYCLDCHGNELAEGRINLQQMTEKPDLGRGFKDWEKVIGILRAKKMPPKDAPQPTEEERFAASNAISQALDEHIRRHAGDPGAVVLRRLTSAEFAYTIEDLIGFDLKLERRFVSDAVGGEGFTNVGAAQFMQDSTLEQYLEAAKTVADHAVIGAGPLIFFEHPRQTGRELSAITRIKEIYRRTGFRTAAGEGAVPFGLDLYPRAMLVAWRFRHKAALGFGDTTLETLAHEEGVSVRLCEHVWHIVNHPGPTFPLAPIVAQWHSLPIPSSGRPSDDEIRAACDRVATEMRQWQSVLAAAAGDEEEAAVLTDGEVSVRTNHSLQADIDWTDGVGTAELELSVSSASKGSSAGALVIWRKPRLRFTHADRRRGETIPLVSALAPETIRRLRLGRHPSGVALGEDDFVLTGESKTPIQLRIPDGMIAARLFMDIELDTQHGADAIVRCRISDGAVAGETAAEVGDTSTLLGDPASPAVAAWQTGVAEFARLLPEVSHREPAPSDRDPIPAPYDNTYNMPERNYFHSTIKYHRDDRFLVTHVLDDHARVELDEAWTDLLTSFDYHDLNLRFAATKFGADVAGKSVVDLQQDDIDRFPEGQRRFVQRLRDENKSMRQALEAAEPKHLEDALSFAKRAWRRALSREEELRLRAFYTTVRRDNQLEHSQAIRSLLARIVVAPSFLYRAEAASDGTGGTRGIAALSDSELASRLSYLVWSSSPDAELTRAAAAGELQHTEKLAKQVRRMARDPKSRRFAAEFFGQWLGFYRFDDYRGIDTERFPEFNEALRAAMYEESVSFFEHLVREDRPVRDILFADYTFLNASLARHYGVDTTEIAENRLTQVGNLSDQHRGGLLGMGAVLTITSAPLRTSAVKRGDWVLRRVLGTPVPPPPADAGSIAADDAGTDGLTVRQRLEAHRTDQTCKNCHARIDPLGFALEYYDPIGRWRDQYRDGQPIDSQGVLSDGTLVDGLAGLRRYLQEQQPQFERNLCGKLLGYALGRTELGSDRPLIQQMQADLTEKGRISDLLVDIATSQQFRYRRL